mgnify:FL=1
MAVLTSHTLNGFDGTHAGFIPVRLINLTNQICLFDTKMDAGGRLKETLDARLLSPEARYELVFETKDYWQNQDLIRARLHIMDEIIFRFSMPDREGHYHIPIIINPNSYSVWWSGD